MGKTKIVLNRAGVRELMQSPEMQAILVEHANKIASASDAEAYVAQTRAVVKGSWILPEQQLRKRQQPYPVLSPL